MKRKGNTEEAIDVFQRMKRDRCKPTTETYNLMINLYGKVYSLTLFAMNTLGFRKFHIHVIDFLAGK
jgi:pentatricopeptide repeat protein